MVATISSGVSTPLRSSLSMRTSLRCLPVSSATMAEERMISCASCLPMPFSVSFIMRGSAMTSPREDSMFSSILSRWISSPE